MYLFHLLTSDQSSLVSLVFQEQVKSMRQTGWVREVSSDLKDLGIDFSFSQISKMTKKEFSDRVKKASEKSCFDNLIKQKDKLSKGRGLEYVRLEMQHYLRSESSVSLESMRKIYHIRCREVPVKANFPSAHKNILCLFPSCQNDDSQIL